MRDKTKIGFVSGAVDSDFLVALAKRLEEESPGEFELVELSPANQPEICHPFDNLFPAMELDRKLIVIIRQPFRVKFAERIDRYNRVWPRNGAPMLTWNRDRKWLPRFYDSPRKFYFSQSQLRLSQVTSLRSFTDTHRNTVCSLADLDLSRWP